MSRWSYSAWQAYKQCPFKFKCAYLERLPQEQSEALERGNAVHADIESYLRGETAAVPAAAIRFDTHLKALRKKPGLVVEQAMAFTDKWFPCAWDSPEAWLRMKLDVLHPVGSNGAFVGDWKTGKVYQDHPEQLGIYGLGCFKGLEVDVVLGEDWYVDSGIKSKEERFNRDTDERPLTAMWEGRASRMFSDKNYAPTVNKFCKWCAFSKGKGGPCKHG